MTKKTKKLNKEKERLTEEMFLHCAPIIIDWTKNTMVDFRQSTFRDFKENTKTESVDYFKYPADFIPPVINGSRTTGGCFPKRIWPLDAEYKEEDGMRIFQNAHVLQLNSDFNIFVGHDNYAFIYDDKHICIGVQRISEDPMYWSVINYEDDIAALVGYPEENLNTKSPIVTRIDPSDNVEYLEFWHGVLEKALVVYIRRPFDQWHFRTGESIFYDKELYPWIRKKVRKWLKKEGTACNEKEI